MPQPTKKKLKIALKELTQELLNDPAPTPKKLETLKRNIAKQYRLKRFVRNSEILEYIFSSDHLSMISYIASICPYSAALTRAQFKSVAPFSIASLIPSRSPFLYASNNLSFDVIICLLFFELFNQKLHSSLTFLFHIYLPPFLLSFTNLTIFTYVVGTLVYKCCVFCILIYLIGKQSTHDST